MGVLDDFLTEIQIEDFEYLEEYVFSNGLLLHIYNIDM